jgi:hypothetical protein
MIDYNLLKQGLINPKAILHFEKPSSELHLDKIEGIINKSLPKDFVDFYSFCAGIDWRHKRNKNTGTVLEHSVCSLQEMFGNYAKIIPATHQMGSTKEIKKLRKKNPFYYITWNDEWYECHLDQEESLSHLNYLMNLKLLVQGQLGCCNLVIDFFDEKKDYQIYFQDHGRILPLAIDLPKFVKIFIQIGCSYNWFLVFSEIEYQGVRFNLSKLETDFPDFDMQLLKIP